MASSSRWVEYSVSFSNRVRQYSFSPLAPQLGEHRTIRERSWGHLVHYLPKFTEPGIPVVILKEGQ